VPRLCGHPEKLAIFLSIRARSRGRAGDQGRGRGSSVGRGPLTCGPSRRPCATAEDPDPQAGGKRPPPFYPSRLYWSSVLCSPFWLVRCRTLPATVSSAVLAPILIGIKAPCPRGRCVVCTRQASLRSCCWLLLLLWFVPGLASSSWASCGLEVLDL
jgi:hypothetical protein